MATSSGPPPSAMYARIRTIIAEARLDSGSGGYDNSSGGGSSPASPGASESDGSSSADEFCPHEQGEFGSHACPLSSSARADQLDFDHRECVRQASVSSPRALDDIHGRQQRVLLLLLPAFASPADAAARAEALSRWLSGFDVAWVLDTGGASGGGEGTLPRRELGRRVGAWAQALGDMERVFRLGHREELAPAQAAALGELAAASAGAMLRLVGAVAALGSSPSKLLVALDMHAPLSETYPVLARFFSWALDHPVPAAAEAALAGLVDATRSCGRDLRAFVRSHYPWRMPQGGEVHPCVGFWMGYFRCMLRNRASLHLVLGSDDGGESPAPGAEGGCGLVVELVSCLEAALEENAAALAFPGLRQVFMLNNTHAVARRVAGSDLRHLLPPEWLRVREERMEGHIKGYMDASWALVVSRLDGGGGSRFAKQPARRRSSLSAFYAAFENACSTQRCWKVPDPALRGVLREAVSELVVSAYRRYLEEHPEVKAAPGRTTEELDQQLSDLFEG